jgi:hypothetical protein
LTADIPACNDIVPEKVIPVLVEKLYDIKNPGPKNTAYQSNDEQCGTLIFAHTGEFTVSFHEPRAGQKTDSRHYTIPTDRQISNFKGDRIHGSILRLFFCGKKSAGGAFPFYKEYTTVTKICQDTQGSIHYRPFSI